MNDCTPKRRGIAPQVNPIRIEGDVAYCTFSNIHIKGEFLIDTADVPKIVELGYKWTVNKLGYVRLRYTIDKVETRIALHNFLMQTPKGMEVDHINRNPLDNRRCNLRIVDKKTNCRNRVIRVGATGVRNVSYNESRKQYEVKFLFDTLEQATIASEMLREFRGY
jgi:hypothetical protein